MDVFSPSVTKEEMEKLPRYLYEGNIVLIEREEDVNSICRKLARQRVLGFDTESKAAFKKGVKNKPSLIQLATHNDVFLFRISYAGFTSSLIRILESDKILKVGVAVKQDIGELQQLKSFRPSAFVELQEYSSQFGITDNSLKKMAAIVLGKYISKSQRLSDWEAKQLKMSQLQYAATDAWVSRAIYLKLKENEREKGHTETGQG
jgi:ribonuclease D